MNRWRLGAWAALALNAWQLLPDRYMGPYNAWNPHAIMEFVITLLGISLVGQWAIHRWGAHHGVWVTGLIGGFASSTATIHAMGRLAKSSPALAGQAALGGVLSNLATLVQLAVLLQLLAPPLLVLFIQPMCAGMVSMCAYAAWVLMRHTTQPEPVATQADDVTWLSWQSLLSLTALVCGVSYASAALNALYGEGGLLLGAALSGLVDAHAIVPTVASLLAQNQLLPPDALMPLLLALGANTVTKSLIAFQSGGWHYAQQVSGGVWLTAGAVWLGYLTL